MLLETYHAQGAREFSQEVMFIQLHARFVLVKESKLQLLHFFKVIINDKLLGEGWVEVIHGCLCPVNLQLEKEFE